MTNPNALDRPDQGHEKALFRYTRALERGDFAAVAEVLRDAESDPALARLIAEIDEEYAVEMERQSLAHPAAGPREKLRLPRFGWITAAAAVVVLAMFVVGILTLRGAAIGNVFGNTVNGLYMPGYADGNRENFATQAAMLPTPAPAEVTGGPGLLVTPLALPTGTPLATPSPLGALASTEAAAATAEPGQQAPPIQPQEAMIVKNGDISLIVESTDRAMAQVTQIAVDGGGYVLTSQAWSDGVYKSAYLTIAVRSDQFEVAMRRLREIALEVLSETSSGQDVSAEYVDLQSRLRNLEATRDRILSFLDSASTVTEALEINRQLAEIEAQIEQVKGRMTYLSGCAAYSTINVNIQQKVDATITPTPTPTLTPTPMPPWSLGPRVEAATRTQTELARGLLEVLVWLVIVPGPYLAALIVLVVLVRAIMGRARGGPGG